jgi:hypothetical protein
MENVDMKTKVTGMDARELHMPQLVCLRNSLCLFVYADDEPVPFVLLTLLCPWKVAGQGQVHC